MIKNITVSKKGKFLFNRRIVKESDVILKNGDTFTGELVLRQGNPDWNCPSRLMLECKEDSATTLLDKLETMARVGKLTGNQWQIISFNQKKREHTLLWGYGYFTSIDVFPNPDIYFSFNKEDSAKK